MNFQVQNLKIFAAGARKSEIFGKIGGAGAFDRGGIPPQIPCGQQGGIWGGTIFFQKFGGGHGRQGGDPPPSPPCRGNPGKYCIRCRIKNKARLKVLMGPLGEENLKIAPAFYSSQGDISGPYLSYSNINKRCGSCYLCAVPLVPWMSR